LAAMVLLPLLGYGILRSSRVQTYLGQRIAAYLSRQLETNVSVGGVDVTFFLNFVLEDVLVEDQREEQMIFSKRMVLDISKISFRKRFLSINRLRLDQTFLGLSRYGGEADFNFRFLLDYFSADVPDSEKKRWSIVCKSLEFSNSAFSFQDHNKVPADFAFDPGHFAVADFAMAMDDIRLLNDTLSFELDRLAFREAKGFELQYLSGSFLVSPQHAHIENLMVRTPLSDLQLQAIFDYESYDAFDHFFDEINLEITLEESRLNLADAGFFIPAAYGIEGPVRLRGNFRGTPANLRGSDLFLNYGRSTNLRGNFHLMGLPDIGETFINFSLDEMRTSVADIKGFRLPLKSENNYLQIPDNLSNLGRISFRGRFTGFVNDMVAFGQLQTDIGRLSSDILVRQYQGKGLPYYKGSLITEDFDLGKFFVAEDRLGLVSLNAQVEGRGITLATVDMTITGQIESIELMRYNYENLDISGNISNKKFNGSLLVEDPNVFLDFQGIIDFEETTPVFDFNARFEQANLTSLNFYQRDSIAESVVSGFLSINARASGLNDLVGRITLDNLLYEERPLDGSEPIHYESGRIQLVNSIEDDDSKLVRLRSDFADVDLSGWFRFDRLGQSVRSLVEAYIPAFYKHLPPNGLYENFLQNTAFEIRFKETENLSDLFFPFIRLSPGSVLKGKFGDDFGQLELDGWSGLLVFAGNRFVDWKIEGQQEKGAFQLAMESRSVFISDSIFIDRFNLGTELRNDSLHYLIEWRNFDTSKQNYAHIEGLARVFDRRHSVINFLPSYAMINDSLWRIDPGNQIIIDSARVEVKTFLISKNEEYVLVDGVLSASAEDEMRIEFNDFDVANVSHLLRARNLNFDGLISGQLALGALNNSPRIEADLYVRSFAFNFDHLGDLHLISNWDSRQKAIKVNLEVIYYGNVGTNKPLSAKGLIYTERKDNNFDLDITAENLKMSIWGRYLESFASNFRGQASGSLRLEGPFSKPELSGKVRLARAGFRINFLNTSYTFADELVINKDHFSFENIIINDTLGNIGLASGRISHETFKNWGLDIWLRPEQLALLNTRPGQNDVMFYGRAFGTGQAHIHGPVENIVMDITGRTNRGTQIFLPLDYTDEVTESNFITFVTRDTTRAVVPIQLPEVGNLTLNFDLEVTPDAEMQLIFDSQIGDIIRGRGTGNIKMEIPASGNFAMYGDYTIEEGDYLFTLQNIINKRFRIEQGGTIRWTGDPLDADIDLRAVYRLRTALHDLVMDMDTSDVYRRRVPVETILILRDKLFNPTITFDIGIPGGDEGTRELLERLITTEQEMNRQVFSLLVLNRFMPTALDQYNTALGYGVGSTSSELLSNQLSNWLSQISSDFDIGINYRPGDEISSQELEVALSTQLFNDRVILDGNVGVAGQNPAAGTQRTSSIIGDVNVEVKITPEGKFRIKAFNRSNTFDIVNTNSPYTQGIGVFYRKEFDNLSELWRRSRRLESNPELEEVVPVEVL
jgi:hypothetical protein